MRRERFSRHRKSKLMLIGDVLFIFLGEYNASAIF